MRKMRITKKRLPMVLLAIAGGLTAWVFELGAVLQGQAQVRNWSSVWVGLDLLEIAGLIMTALLIKRRSAFLAPVAAMTATAFALDAWFDVMTAMPGGSWYESLAAAAFGEVPMALGLAWIVWWSVRTGPGQAAGTTSTPAARISATARSLVSTATPTVRPSSTRVSNPTSAASSAVARTQ